MNLFTQAKQESYNQTFKGTEWNNVCCDWPNVV